MAFRIEKAIGIIVIFSAALSAGDLTAQVRHKHLRNGGIGQIEINAGGISFKEIGKHAEHSQEWRYEDIQQLTLRPNEITILTYDSDKWELGRVREYVFDQLPEGFAAQVYALLRAKLDQRFAAHISDAAVKPLWQAPAKLVRRFGGTQGALLIGEDRIEFKSEKGESYTWRLTDVQNVSSSGPFDLSITTLEESGVLRGGTSEYRFQLKASLSEARYNELWQRVNAANGLQVLFSPRDVIPETDRVKSPSK